MEGGNSFEQSLGNWEVYKDNFAPPPRARSKPWERAAVSAHAPRLQGQKIWKKTGLKIKQDANKEKCDAAQLELEKEGAGARKRMRVVGGKENISDALWKNEVSEESLEVLNSIPSPNKRERKSIAGGSPDRLQVIPRKRTNANHLITARKLARRAPVNDPNQTVEIFPRKSPQKLQLNHVTMLDASCEPPMKIPLNDTLVVLQPALEKPDRRRKSLRRSTRRLTRGDDIDEQKPAPVASPTKSEFAPLFHEPTTEVRLGETRVKTQFQRISVNDDPMHLTELLPAEGSIPGSRSREAECLALAGEIMTLIPDDEKPRKDDDHIIILPATGNPSSKEQEITVGEVQEGPALENVPVTLESVEIPSKPLSPPIKYSSTPRSRKRANSQRQGTRRNTRTTCASSVPPEGHAPETQQQVEVIVEAVAEQSKRTQKEIFETEQEEDIAPSANLLKSLPTQESPDQGQRVEPTHKHNEASEVEAEIVRKPILEPGFEPETTHPVDACNSLGGVRPTSSIIPEPAAETNVSIQHEISGELEGKKYVNTTNSSNRAEGAYVKTHDIVSPSPEEPFEEDIVTQDLQITDLESDICLTLPIEAKTLPASPVEAMSTKQLLPNIDPVSDDTSEEDPEVFEPVSISAPAENLLDSTTTEIEDLPETSTPHPSTTDLIEAISENAPSVTYDHDDTDLLRNFLTRVKANKEAKAKSTQKRKRSFPHSPIRLPLGGAETTLSPKDEFDVSLPALSPTKRRKRNETAIDEEDTTEPKSIRRSGRTRLPIKAAAVSAPSFIPVRRLGLDGENTVTLRRSEEKELAALTRVNTRKNKGGALSPLELLAKKAEEKDDPASRQRALKERFDEKSQAQKSKLVKSVVWAEELAQYQNADGKKVEIEKDPEEEKEKPVREETKGAVKVGVRSNRISLGMAVNGTPAPKRKVKGRS